MLATREAIFDQTAVVRPDQRIPALDGLRAIASLMVVFYHFGPHIVRNGGPFSFLHWLPETVWQGVDLFFVLSGFLIASILFEVRESPHYFKTFYARRAFRLLPLYYLVLLGYVAAVGILGERTRELGRLFENPLGLATFFFYAQNFAMTAAGSFGPTWLAGTWSLAVEEQFYFTLPLMIRRFTTRTMWRMVFAGFLGALFLRGAINKFKFLPVIGAYVLLPARLDSLAAGVFVAMLVRYRYDLIARRARLIRRGTIVAAVVWMIWECVPNPQSIRLHFIAYSAWATIFAGLLLSVLVSPDTRLSRFLSVPWMRELGNMAYSTYMLHGIALCIVFRIWRGCDPQLDSLADLPPLGVALILALLASWVSWRFFERKMLVIGRNYRY